MRIEGLMPIGSVVILKEGRHRMMIIGYCQKKLDSKEEKIFDYVGCLYPEGYISADQCYLFDREQIETVYHVGYQTDGQFALIEQIDDAIRTLREDKQEKT